MSTLLFLSEFTYFFFLSFFQIKRFLLFLVIKFNNDFNLMDSNDINGDLNNNQSNYNSFIENQSINISQFTPSKLFNDQVQ